MRADRLLDLIALLRRHERMTSTQLAERLGVSRRTVLRDLDALSSAGVPVYAEHGRRGGFALLPGYRPETAGLTPTEASALFLPGGDVAASALGRGQEFRAARRKLEAVLDDDAARGVGDVARWLLVVPEGWGCAVEPPAMVPVAGAAAARRRIVDLAYRAVGQPMVVRRVRPMGLVLAGRSWYLLALRDDTGELRTYRAERIGALDETGSTFDPGDLTLEEAWQRARASLRGRAGIRVVVRAPTTSLSLVTFLMSQVGRIVEVRDETPGSHLVLGEADRLSAAATLLCGLGPRGEVMEPPKLRAAIHELASAALTRYAP